MLATFTTSHYIFKNNATTQIFFQAKTTFLRIKSTDTITLEIGVLGESSVRTAEQRHMMKIVIFLI